MAVVVVVMRWKGPPVGSRRRDERQRIRGSPHRARRTRRGPTPEEQSPGRGRGNRRGRHTRRRRCHSRACSCTRTAAVHGSVAQTRTEAADRLRRLLSACGHSYCSSSVADIADSWDEERHCGGGGDCCCCCCCMMMMVMLLLYCGCLGPGPGPGHGRHIWACSGCHLKKAFWAQGAVVASKPADGRLLQSHVLLLLLLGAH